MNTYVTKTLNGSPSIIAAWDFQRGFTSLKLRNQDVFQIGEKVFLLLSRSGGDIVLKKGIVVEIKMTDSENPEHLYVVKYESGLFGKLEDVIASEPTTCAFLYRSPEEAKESVLRYVKHMQEKELQYIEEALK